jgi:hypothetical protein
MDEGKSSLTAAAPPLQLEYSAEAPRMQLNQKMRLDIRGPVILNANGTMSRIAKWNELSEMEKDRSWRLIVKRNAERMEKLQGLLEKQKKEHTENQQRLAKLLAIQEEEDKAPLDPQVISGFVSFMTTFSARFPSLPSHLQQALSDLVARQDRRLVRSFVKLPHILPPGLAHPLDSEVAIDAVLAVPLSDLQTAWDRWFMHCSTQEANDISLEARHVLTEANKPAGHLVYGEFTFESVGLALSKVPLSHQHKVFVDLGSGSGRVVMAALRLHHFSRLLGVEVVEGLHEKAQAVLHEFWQESGRRDRRSESTLNSLSRGSVDGKGAEAEPNVSFVLADFRSLELARIRVTLLPYCSQQPSVQLYDHHSH